MVQDILTEGWKRWEAGSGGSGLNDDVGAFRPLQEDKRIYYYDDLLMMDILQQDDNPGYGLGANVKVRCPVGKG